MRDMARKYGQGQSEPKNTEISVSQQYLANSLALGVQYHRAGNIRQAEEIYRQILRQDADHADTLHLLGVLCHQDGRHDIAIDLISKAIRRNPLVPSYHNNMGVVLQAQGRPDAAIESYQEALRVKADYAEAYNNLGNALKDQGNLDAAIQCYQRALRLEPHSVETHLNLGIALQSKGNLDAAIESYHEALRLNPDLAKVHYNMGVALQARGKPDDAIESYKEALRLEPDYAEAYNNLGNALKEQGNLDAAIKCYYDALRLKPNSAGSHYNIGMALQSKGNLEAAIESYKGALRLKPDYAEAYNNLGNALKEQGNLDAAIGSCYEALRLKPDYAEAYNNLGNALKEQGNLEAAIESYDKALRIKPDYATAHFNKSLALLLSGNFAEGWCEYEWRFRDNEVAQEAGYRKFTQPMWDGSPLEGRTVLVHSEQGLGDTIQFIRYLPLVKQRGGHVIFECQRPLVRIMQSFQGIDLLIEKSENSVPDVVFDVYIPLLGLPRIFGTTLDNILREVPYLKADQMRAVSIRGQLDSNRLRVGLVWAGKSKHKEDRKRSCALEAFASLASVPGVTFYSLQKGDAAKEGRRPPEGMTLIDLDMELDDFADSAALVSVLDLVVSVDTAIAHLAGAMARPVWILLPFIPDWRWLMEREDSPWYPTMRLFRQPKPGAWDAVIEQVTHELGNLVR